MRKLMFVSLVVGGAMSATVSLSALASAWGDWCSRSSYGYYSPRTYSYAPVTYRSCYRPAFYYGASFYRPRVWGWRSWGGRH